MHSRSMNVGFFTTYIPHTRSTHWLNAYWSNHRKLADTCPLIEDIPKVCKKPSNSWTYEFELVDHLQSRGTKCALFHTKTFHMILMLSYSKQHFLFAYHPAKLHTFWTVNNHLSIPQDLERKPVTPETTS